MLELLLAFTHMWTRAEEGSVEHGEVPGLQTIEGFTQIVGRRTGFVLVCCREPQEEPTAEEEAGRERAPKTVGEARGVWAEATEDVGRLAVNKIARIAPETRAVRARSR